MLISAWAVRLGFNQEGIMRDWLMFVRLVSGKESPRQKEQHKQRHDNIKQPDRVWGELQGS